MAPALISACPELRSSWKCLPSCPVLTLRLLCSTQQWEGRRCPSSALFVRFHLSGFTTDGCPVTNGDDQILVVAKLSEYIPCVSRFQFITDVDLRRNKWSRSSRMSDDAVRWKFPTHNWPKPVFLFLYGTSSSSQGHAYVGSRDVHSPFLRLNKAK